MFRLICLDIAAVLFFCVAQSFEFCFIKNGTEEFGEGEGRSARLLEVNLP